jgi:hypothetical protein
MSSLAINFKKFKYFNSQKRKMGGVVTTQTLNEESLRMYAALKHAGYALPSPDMHMFLTGVAVESQISVPSFLSHSQEDLVNIAKAYRDDDEPNAVPYLFGRETAIFHIGYVGKKTTRNPEFAQLCFRYASHFAEKMGKTTESELMRKVALGIGKYQQLLNKYYESTRQRGFKATEDDVLSFLDYIQMDIEAKKYNVQSN